MDLDGLSFSNNFDKMVLEMYNFGLEQRNRNFINFDRMKQLLQEKGYDATEIELLMLELIKGFCKRPR